MNAWLNFWVIWLVIAGAAFAGITLIVAVKGFRDLRNMFSGLTAGEKTKE